MTADIQAEMRSARGYQMWRYGGTEICNEGLQERAAGQVVPWDLIYWDAIQPFISSRMLFPAMCRAVSAPR